MKKLLLLLTCITLMNSCDDGDLTVESFDFAEETVQRCDNKIYKLTDTEALILQVPFTEAFINDATPVGAPRIFPIGTNNFVVYRSYNGNVSNQNICAVLPPLTPTATQEWVATSGSIEITTVGVKINNTVLDGGEILDKYRHTITLRNVNFVKPDGSSQLYNTMVFGTYDTDFINLQFNFDDELAQCSGLVYNFAGSEALTLAIDPTLLAAAVTTTPRTGLISQTTNKLTYRTYSNVVLDDAFFCASTPPATPIQEWLAIDGIADISGIVEVTTTSGAGVGVFEHTIRLKKVTFKRGNTEFLLADDYLLGVLITN